MSAKKSFWTVGAAPITFTDRSATTQSAPPAAASSSSKKAATAPNSPVMGTLPESLLSLSFDENMRKLLEREEESRRIQAGGLSHNDLFGSPSSSTSYDANAPRAGAGGSTTSRLHTLLALPIGAGGSVAGPTGEFNESTDPRQLFKRIVELTDDVGLLGQELERVRAENAHYVQLLTLAAQAGFQAPGFTPNGPISHQQQAHGSPKAMMAERLRHQKAQLDHDYALRVAQLQAQSARINSEQMYDHGTPRGTGGSPLAGNMFSSQAPRFGLAASVKTKSPQTSNLYY